MNTKNNTTYPSILMGTFSFELPKSTTRINSHSYFKIQYTDKIQSAVSPLPISSVSSSVTGEDNYKCPVF